MGTFLAEVLRTADKAEMEDLIIKISDITKSVYELKCEVKREIEETYVSFSKLPAESHALVSRLKLISGEMEVLDDRVKTRTKRDLENSTGELKSLSSSLQEVTLMLHEVKQLVSLDNLLKEAISAKENGKYLETAKKLQQMQELLDKVSNPEVKLYKALKKEKIYVHEHFLFDMFECWKHCLMWEERETEKDRKRVCLKIDISRLNEIEHMFQALSYIKNLDYELSKFGNKVMKFILSPLISHFGSVETVTDSTTAVLDVETISSSEKPDYVTVLTNLGKVFNFFCKYLSLETDQNVTFLRKLGKVISDEFCELLIKNCLADTIPSHSNDLKSFEAVAAKAEEFHNKLLEIGFLEECSKSILDYAKNIDVLFANKICEMHLKHARDIMKKDLYDMMLVTPSFPSQELTIKNEFHFKSLEPDIRLSDNTFQFPQCHISKSAKELLDMVYALLDEAVGSTDLSSVRLFYSARKIIELYCAVVPIHHSTFLEKIPQQVALFHNNCMYLAHHLVTLGVEYKDRLPSVLRNHTITFIDLVHKLRELGTTTFLKYMQEQRKQILDILRDSGLASIENSTLPSNTEKAIRQCLRQIEILQTVWLDVLPSNVYSKAMGCLVNSFVEDIIIRIVTLEDIPAHVATQLADVFKVVIDRAPQVFQEPREVHRNVRQWQKFCELVLVLQASLTEINDRWADGKGPLAQEFKGDEVKQLVRALFQNNKKRSAILALIK
ncbi:centromere/kinetochore protein zw10 homolog [Anabrus simplex]|uniref:centromere/kinetochore protein zw10 homolog n=1 Tax=Anabrus simplex TaxID=316456 RepID=UPI0034DD5C36